MICKGISRFFAAGPGSTFRTKLTKRTYDNAYKEAYDEAYKEALNEMLAEELADA